MSTYNLFTTPIDCIDDLVNEQRLDAILNDISDFKQQVAATLQYEQARKKSRPLTTNVFTQNICDKIPSLRYITDVIDDSVQHYGQRLTGDRNRAYSISHAWLAIQGDGHYVQRHNHTFVTDLQKTNSSVEVIMINAIFYLQATEEDRLSLYYPHQNMMITNIVDKGMFGMVAGSVACRRNRLLLIPSWLDHSVNARPRDNEKICLSVNYKLA